jgi:predicted nuclease with RNAse H fold
MALAGVDFGSKLAGTTVLASPLSAPLLLRSRKGADADTFLLDTLIGQGVRFVFLDAPLSLPGVYLSMPGFGDFLFREGDRRLGAMSPMFLGGLTARAMRLKSLLEAEGITVFETYPAAQAKRLGLNALGYKKSKDTLPVVVGHLAPMLEPLGFSPGGIATWHDVDALLALLAAVRWSMGEAEFWGHEAEGGIWV